MSEVITMTISAVALGVTGVVLKRAAAAIAEAVAAARLSAQSRRAIEDLTAALPRNVETISPGQALHTEGLLEQIHSAGVPRHEARLVAQLAYAARLAASDTTQLANSLRARPVEEWAGIIRQNHEQLFRQSLTDAVARACRRLECRRVEGAAGQLVAEDPGGRTLAVEVADDGKIKAEVLGVADGSCHALVDRFLSALEAEGVRVAKVNDRRWTGGAPYTAAGIRWVSKKAVKTGATDQSKAADRRLKATPRQVRIKR